MITNKLMGKVTALAMLPALTLGLFAAPALAMGHGDLTVVNVQNDNEAAVINAFEVEANTGRNAVVGGDGGDGGEGGDINGRAGDGARGGDGGNARVEDESRADNEAYAGEGARGGDGGDQGETGNGGRAGAGARGGDITTGDAIATALVSNDTNTTDTRITLEDCNECDQYNEFYLEADRYYEEWNKDWRHQEECRSRPMMHRERESSSESYMEEDEHLMMYTKTYVPETTLVNVQNDNEALVMNLGRVEANTGENAAVGGDGGDGGDAGDIKGRAGDGARGGDGGRAVIEDDDFDLDLQVVPVKSWGYPMRYHHRDDNIAVGGDGARGGDGGDQGTTGAGSSGAAGGPGGSVDTGVADALADVVNVTNRSVTRINR